MKRVRKKNKPKSPVEMHSMIRQAPDLLPGRRVPGQATIATYALMASTDPGARRPGDRRAGVATRQVEVITILATRHDVRLGLHQLRLAGELAEIRAADLCFSERETRELLDASGIALSAAGAALLHQRTEGWAAGLRLAAISLTGHPDPERFVTEFSGSDRTVAEYLLAEMLDRQLPDVQDLLLRTSLLDRVNGELADLLTPHHHGAYTVLTGQLDRSALYGVLAEIEALGLDLLEIRKLTPDRESPGSGDCRLP
jgi:hypothetical protein